MKLTNANYNRCKVNQEIYDLIAPGTFVLDVGCGNGKLARKLINKKLCQVIGIDKECYNNTLTAFFHLDISKPPRLKKLNQQFDYIVFSDSLEHLPNPDEVLLWAKKYLKDSGKLLISIPNVANWQIRLKTLLGRFEYDGGLLDWGHLRFFTLRGIKALLEKCGYRVTSVGIRNKKIRFLAKLWKEMFAFQFIIVAEKI